ncbi:MAG TPA: Crp/Fnr family transcriptional regulator [Ramlibacter sp.]|nr:Crp/Fnr family transcriptional regulator [Ramlibacter sp.]
MTHSNIEQALRDFLDGSSWMRGLTQAQTDRVRDDITARAFPTGAMVCARATPSNQWLGVVEGMLKVETIAREGKAATFAGVPAGAWMGEGAVLKGEPRPYDVVAIRDSVVAFLPRSTFLWLVAESHPFALWLIQQLNARLGYYVALVQSFRLNDTTAQVAYCLAELFNQDLYPTLRRQVAISQEEIGRLSGVSRQIANRALKELDGRGIIRMGYGTVEVLDLLALQKLAHGT